MPSGVTESTPRLCLDVSWPSSRNRLLAQNPLHNLFEAFQILGTFVIIGEEYEYLSGLIVVERGEPLTDSVDVSHVAFFVF